jgi:acetyl esterase/lipase
VLKQLAAFGPATANVPRRERLARMRTMMDQMGEGLELGVRIVPVSAEGIAAEWVIDTQARRGRRLLYLHGGAFTRGSPKSHRAITANMSRKARAAVLAIDYRLMPEHRRRDGIADCQSAYRWILDNGPDGERSPPKTLFVAGDSAGGNLALMITAWARDQGLRPPDGAFALSPGTDGTMSSPSLANNVATDAMLGPLFGPIARIPRTILLLFGWFSNRINPSDPLVSPLYNDLARLPQTLIHASETEMLIDDARRYANKARAAGSPVTLETWDGMVHVWHAFVLTLPEAQDAFERMGEFFERLRAECTVRVGCCVAGLNRDRKDSKAFGRIWAPDPAQPKAMCDICAKFRDYIGEQLAARGLSVSSHSAATAKSDSHTFRAADGPLHARKPQVPLDRRAPASTTRS